VTIPSPDSEFDDASLGERPRVVGIVLGRDRISNELRLDRPIESETRTGGTAARCALTEDFTETSARNVPTDTGLRSYSPREGGPVSFFPPFIKYFPRTIEGGSAAARW